MVSLTHCFTQNIVLLLVLCKDQPNTTQINSGLEMSAVSVVVECGNLLNFVLFAQRLMIRSKPDRRDFVVDY